MNSATNTYDSETLTLLVYGPSKSGKSFLSATAPEPRLILDVENGYRFIPGLNTISWDPKTEDPPTTDTPGWDTALVHVSDYDTVLRAYAWILAGKTPFRSVVIDSVSELQAKVIEDVTGGREAVQMRGWGDILRAMTGLFRDFRDLVASPLNNVECLVLTAMEQQQSDGRIQPYQQGQSRVILPYIVDVCGYLTTESFPHEDPTQGRYTVRRMYISGHQHALTGERVGGRLGHNGIIEQNDLNIQSMIKNIYHPSSPLTNTPNFQEELTLENKKA